MAEKQEKSWHDEVRDDIVIALRKTFPTKYDIETEKSIADRAGRADIAITFKKDGKRLTCEVYDTHPIELLSGPTKKLTELVRRIETKADTMSLSSIEKVKEAVLEIRASIINSVQTQEKISEQQKQYLIRFGYYTGVALTYCLMHDVMIIIAEDFIEWLYLKDFYRRVYFQKQFRNEWVPFMLGKSDAFSCPDSIPELKQLIEKSQKRVSTARTFYSNLPIKDITFLRDTVMTELEPKSDVKSKYVLMKENSEK